MTKAHVSRVVLNPLGIAALAKSAEMELLLKTKADAIAERARSLAPYDPEQPPPHYRDEITTDSSRDEDGTALARVNANVPWADDIEFGTDDTPTFAVLRRAAGG